MSTKNERKLRALINRITYDMTMFTTCDRYNKPTFDNKEHNNRKAGKSFFIALDMQKAMKMEGCGKPSQERGIVP